MSCGLRVGLRWRLLERKGGQRGQELDGCGRVGTGTDRRKRLSFRLRLATGAVAGGEAKVDLMDGVDRVDMVDGELGDRRVKFRVFKHREFETQS